MKPVFLILRILIVGLLWSVFFIEGIRVIMLTNWHFDILRTSHWVHAWNLWISGWVIDETKEWAFILIVFSMIPVWITVWVALSSVKWEQLLKKTCVLPLIIFSRLFEDQIKSYKNSASLKVVKKKKSYKEVRPRAAGRPIEDSAYQPMSVFDEEKRAALSGITPRQRTKPSSIPQPSIKTVEPKEFSHSLFNMDDEEPLDFDLFEENIDDSKSSSSQPKENVQEQPQSYKRNDKKESAPHGVVTKKQPAENKSQPKNKQSSANSTFELLKQKGYEVISGATIKNTFIDFIGISKNQICLCLNDKEPGDWLADEERFNDEEPLWFSESSHRISPVRKADLARITLNEKLKDLDLSFEVVPFVIEQIGNIINAEDMLDIWKDMDVNVTRIDRGTPKEIPLFAKTLEDADDPVEKAILEKIKKILRNIA